MTRLVYSFLLTLLLPACTALPNAPRQSDADAVSQEQRAREEAVLPKQALTDNILFGLLASELAVQRGQIELAVPTYLDLAQETRDPRVAKRAAELALAAGNNEAAVAALTLWCALAPASDLAQQQLTLALLRSNRVSEARRLVESQLATYPAQAAVLFTQLTPALPLQVDHVATLHWIANLAQRYPKVPEAQFALLVAATSADDNAQANAVSDQLAILAPNWDLPVLWRVQALRERNQMAAALSYLQHALSIRPKASMALQLAYPRLLVSMNRIPDALQVFEQVAQRAPDSADVHYAIGLIVLQQGDSARAARELTLAFTLGYRDPDVLALTLGQLYEERQDIEAARLWYNRVRSDSAVYLQVQARLAGLDARDGLLDHALNRLAELRKTAEEPLQIDLLSAELARDARQPQRALDLLNQALHQTPNQVDILYERALINDQLGRGIQSIADLRRVLKQRSDDPAVLNALGYTLANYTLHYHEAETLLNRALALDPGNPMILDSKGWLLYKIGRLQEARSYLERAYAQTEDPEIAAHLGEVMWKQGDMTAARMLWQKAHAIQPDNEVLRNTMQRYR